jgi:hypothetical protein
MPLASVGNITYMAKGSEPRGFELIWVGGWLLLGVIVAIGVNLVAGVVIALIFPLCGLAFSFAMRRERERRSRTR